MVEQWIREWGFRNGSQEEQRENSDCFWCEPWNRNSDSLTLPFDKCRNCTSRFQHNIANNLSRNWENPLETTKAS